jgi:hypothetical protein
MLSAAKSKNRHRLRGYLRHGSLAQVVILATDTSLLKTICTYRPILLTTYTDLITTNSCVVRERQIEIFQTTKSSIFWDVMPCSSLKATLVSCLAYFCTQKMEVTCSSETSIDFQRTTEDRTLHNHRCDNSKSSRIMIDVNRHYSSEDIPGKQ